MTVDPSAARVAAHSTHLAFVLDRMTPERLTRQTPDGKWSAQDNLAHLRRCRRALRLWMDGQRAVARFS
jgi:DinB superfamily